MSWDLTASGTKVRGSQVVDLSWNVAAPPAEATIVVYRDGAEVGQSANDGAHRDSIGVRGGGSYTYKICEQSTTNCSAEVTVTF